MALVNIDTSNDDPFYRYKMPKLITKVEGKGNGIKTVLVNMPEIAKALNRPPAYPTKFFGTERGAQVSTKGDKYLVNGKYEEKELADLLDKFIKKYVLCPDCGNPETNMRVSKSKNIIQGKCVACGSRFQFDDTHAVGNFIKKNPPTDEHSIATKNATAATLTEREAKEAKKKERDAEKADKKELRKAAKAAAKEGMPGSPKPEKKSKRAKDDAGDDDEDDDEDWSQDTSEEAVRARREQLEQAIGTSVSGLVHTEADYFEMTPEQRLDAFKKFAQGQHSSKELFDEAQRLDVRSQALGLLLPIKFNESMVVQLKQKPNLALLQRFCLESKDAQLSLLNATAKFVAVTYPTLLSKTSSILMAYYNNDVVEEEAFIAWSEGKSDVLSAEKHRAVVESANQFLAWLKTAESEGDEDDDEDVGFENGADEDEKKEQSVGYGMQRGMPSKKQEKVEEDDLDIDDI